MPEGTVTDATGQCLTVNDPSVPSVVTISDCTGAGGQLWGYGIAVSSDGS
jgi:hypothetical protein